MSTGRPRSPESPFYEGPVCPHPLSDMCHTHAGTLASVGSLCFLIGAFVFFGISETKHGDDWAFGLN